MQAIALLLFFLVPFTLPAQQPSEKEVLGQILEKAKKNDKLQDNYGFTEEAIESHLDSNGKVKDKDTNTYKIIWIEGKPYGQLILVDGRPLTPKEKAEESKRRSEFIKSLHEKKAPEDQFRLSSEELYAKFHFTRQPPDQIGHYVFTFSPRTDVKLRERSRVEKVINHLAGKFWADENFNFLRAEASLQDKVSFGLGFLASVNKLEVIYSQKPFMDAYLPDVFQMKVDARLVLFRSLRQEIDSRCFDYYKKPN